jgi:hypothetical protein
VTRPERELHVRRLLGSLEEHRIDYVLFGAVGAGLYGHVRATADLDIIVAADAENLDRVTAWLESLDTVLKLNPQRPFGPRERWGMQKGSNATVLTRLGQVDLVQKLPGLPAWEVVVRDCEHYDVDGMRVRVLNRRTLIELKRRRGSLQDIADIAAIEALEEL